MLPTKYLIKSASSLMIVCASVSAFAEELIKFDPPVFESVKLLNNTADLNNAMEITPRVASLIATKSRPNLFAKYNSSIYQIVNEENPEFSLATDSFTKDELVKKFIEGFQQEAAKLDVNQVYKFTIQGNMDDMRPDKKCVEVNKGSFSGFELGGYPWQFNSFKVYDPFPSKFKTFCATSVEQAKEYSRIIGSAFGGIVNIVVYFKAIPGLYNYGGLDGLSVYMKILKLEVYEYKKGEKLFEMTGE